MKQSIAYIENALEQLTKYISDLKEEETKYSNEIEELQNKLDFLKNDKLDNGNIQALKVFKNIADFNDFTTNLYRIRNWRIRGEKYKDRAEVLSKYSYWKELKELFNNQDLTNRNINDTQMVTFFDTMYLMYNILNQLTDDKIKSEMKIIMEYKLPISSKPRVDYLLAFRNNIILLEFSKAESSNELSKTHTNKNTQLSGYKSNLQTILNNDNLTINAFPCIYLDESTESNIETNNESMDYVKKLINKLFKDERNKNAFETLADLDI